jgi:hypothetical protein
VVTAPSLLSLSSSALAARGYELARARTENIVLVLAGLAVGMFSSGLVLGVRKHPYLGYAGVLAGVSGVCCTMGRWSRRGQVDDGFEYLNKEEENAEVVQQKILGMRDWVALMSSTLGFLVAVIGGFGDGFE